MTHAVHVAMTGHADRGRVMNRWQTLSMVKSFAVSILMSYLVCCYLQNCQIPEANQEGHDTANYSTLQCQGR